MNLVAPYGNLLALSQRMADCARAQTWDALIALQSEREILIAQLPATLAAVSASDAKLLGDLIRQIQACDNTVREYIDPWQEHTGKLLKSLGPPANHRE